MTETGMLPTENFKLFFGSMAVLEPGTGGSSLVAVSGPSETNIRRHWVITLDLFQEDWDSCLFNIISLPIKLMTILDYVNTLSNMFF